MSDSPSPSVQLHAGRLKGSGAGVWHTNDKCVYWCGKWHNRTAAELHAECLTILADLEKNHPELKKTPPAPERESVNDALMQVHESFHGGANAHAERALELIRKLPDGCYCAKSEEECLGLASTYEGVVIKDGSLLFIRNCSWFTGKAFKADHRTYFDALLAKTLPAETGSKHAHTTLAAFYQAEDSHNVVELGAFLAGAAYAAIPPSASSNG
jgi:hypothetical protein